MNDFITINGFKHNRFYPEQFSEQEMLQKSEALLEQMKTRRSIRHFSSKKFPKKIIENLISTASTAPSGANKQPWIFCVISNPQLKKEIRKAAEEEERLSYDSRMSERWLEDLAPLGTNAHKPFLEEAPFIIVVFKQVYETDKNGKHNNYYVNESVGLACGFLISAIHNVGLATLTHTPSPMNFLTTILERPPNERPFLLLPVGYAAEKVYVPKIAKKELREVSVFYE